MKNGCCYDLVQNNRTRLLYSADLVPVEVEGREVGLHQHWMKLGSSSPRPDVAAPERAMESLLVGQRGDGRSCGDGALIKE